MTEIAGNSGLTDLDKYYQYYGCRARELKKTGHHIIGYVCAYVPIEIITAAGFVPFRLRGEVHEPVTIGDTHMETIVCSLVRGCFDITIKGRYDFLDGIVIPHACDSICRSYDIWKQALPLPFYYLLDIPHSTDRSSLQFFKSVIQDFRHCLGIYAGQEITDDSLSSAISLHNRSRVIIRELYDLRKSDPPLISGTEILKALVAVSSIPVAEGINKLEELLRNVSQRQAKTAGRPRVMVVGAQVDNVAFIELVESAGAEVVVDDLCPGTRENWPEVDVGLSPVAGLADRYLRKIKCARTFREKQGDYPGYLADRFGHIGRMARDFNVSGVVILVYRYCDPFGFEVPQLKSYLDSLSLPVLYIEEEYFISSKARVVTRVQAFLESLAPSP